MPSARLFKHRHMDKCNKAMDRKLRRRDLEMSVRCGKMEFSM